MKKIIALLLFAVLSIYCFGQKGDSIIEKYNEKNALASQKYFYIGDSVMFQSRGGIVKTYKYNYKNQLFEFDYQCRYHVDTSGYMYTEKYQYNKTGELYIILKTNKQDSMKIFLGYDIQKRLIGKGEIIYDGIYSKVIRTIYQYTYDKEGSQIEKLISKETEDVGYNVRKPSKNDSLKLDYCNCDSIHKNWIPKESVFEAPLSDGNGWAKLFNLNNTISKCGYFTKLKLIYGLDYIYNKNGALIQILKYYNGKYIGDCEIKK